ISPDCRAVKRSVALVGTKVTLEGSSKMAAATARQKSASKPVHSPLSLGAAKPARPVCTPHLSEPRAFTSSSVAADAAPQAKVTAAALKIPSIHLFIPKPSSVSRARPGFRSRVEAAAAFRFDPEHAQA